MELKGIEIRKEMAAEYREVENLIREAFWNVYRPGCVEHYVLHTYRDKKDFVPELDLVMIKDGIIIGQIMFVRASINFDDETSLPIMTFGPISILPSYQRQGYGKMLLDYAIDKASQMGVKALCIEGDIRFYGKSGFIKASTKKIHYHGEPRENEVPYFLIKEIEEGCLKGKEGTYHTPEGYFVDAKEAEEFDKLFSKKEKSRNPQQIFK